MADDNEARSNSPEPEGDYRRFLQSMGPDCNDPLPEEDDEIDPDFMDDLTNKLQQMIEKGILAGPNQFVSEENWPQWEDEGLEDQSCVERQEGGANGTALMEAGAITPPTTMPQTTDPAKHQDDIFQPPVCLRTRARHPMTDVDINELEGQLDPDLDTMNLPDEAFEDSSLWDLLNSPTPFNFDGVDAGDLDIDLDLEDPALLETLQEVFNPETLGPVNKQQVQEPPQDQTASTKEDKEQNPANEGGSQRDFFSPAFLNDSNCTQSMHVPTLLVDTPFATIPMKSNTWNSEMIQQLHTLLKAHGQMLLQSYGLSVGHAHLMGEAAEVQKMLDSLSVMRITKAQLPSYPRMVSTALENQQTPGPQFAHKGASQSGQEGPPVINLVEEEAAAQRNDSGENPTNFEFEGEGDPASAPTLGLSTVVDLPFLDVLPYLWCAIKCLSCEPSTSFSSGIDEATMGKMFKSKGFSSQKFPPAITKAFEPLKVFLPELLEVKAEPRGDFWCMAEELLLQWGMIVHPSDWEAIQQTYLAAKKKKEIEHREGSSERRRKRKPFKILHDSSAPLCFNDLVPEVSMCRPNLRKVLKCLEQLSQLGKKYFGKSPGESIFGLAAPKVLVNRAEVAPQLQTCIEPKWVLPNTGSQTAAALVPPILPQAIEGPALPSMQGTELGFSELGDAQPSTSQTIHGAKETINGAQNAINRAHERITLAQEVINGAQKTIDQAQETIGRAQKTIDKAQEDMNKQQSLHWLTQCTQLQGRELSCVKEHLLLMLGQQSSHMAAFINQMDAGDAARLMSSTMDLQSGMNWPLMGSGANLMNACVGESQVDVSAPKQATSCPPAQHVSMMKRARCTEAMSTSGMQSVPFSHAERQTSGHLAQGNAIGGSISHHLKPLAFHHHSVEGRGSGTASQSLACLSGGPSTSCLDESVPPHSWSVAPRQEDSISSEHALAPTDVDNIGTDEQPPKRQKMEGSNRQHTVPGESMGGHHQGNNLGGVADRAGDDNGESRGAQAKVAELM
ncbi:hypothetical protein BSKO_00324 [Bryopsis sp. KO-2023]|nr:hypothetical protein BSKO_00324 [Bryopsis sp. KO-2023]